MNDNSRLPIFLLVVLIGLVFVLALLFNPVTSSPPPTPAIRMINTTAANVTASDYNGFVEFIQGTGITISPNYATNEITFSAPGGSGNSTILSDLGDVQTTNPAYHSILIFNGSQWTDKLFQLDTQSATNDFQIIGINNQTGAITRNQFSVNTQSAANDFQIVGLDNVTGQVTRNQFSVNTQPAANDFQIVGLDNVTGQVTRNQFSVNTLTCSGTDKLSSIDNATGQVICTTDSTGAGGSGIPLPPKKWGELIPKTASAD